MKFKIDEVPNKINEALRNLNTPLTPTDMNGYVYINVDRVKAYYETTEQLRDQLTNDLHELFADITGKFIPFKPNSRIDMMAVFTQYLDIPKSDLMYRGEESLRSEVIQHIREKYNSPFIGLYIQFKEKANLLSSLKSYYENIRPLEGMYNNEGDRIGVLPRIRYKMRDTYRFNSHNPNIQGLDLNIADIVTAPAGWVVVKVDSSQIEPKIYYSTVIRDPLITWLIEQHGDVYFALADYCMRESVEYTKDNLFVLNNIDKKHRTTLKTLVNAGNYGSSLDKLKRLSMQMYKSSVLKTEEGKDKFNLVRRIKELERRYNSQKVPENAKPEIKKQLEEAYSQSAILDEQGAELGERFYRRLVKHPQRVAKDAEIDAKVKRSQDRVVVSPFGDKRPVWGDNGHVKNCFINNPIQMAVSRLSAISVCGALELCHKAPSIIRYAYHKHDEDVYYVRADAAEELAVHLKALREYEIEGWSPIYAESVISLDYKK